jgi:hypothetical protein
MTSGAIPIEIVALNLVSVQPIVVTGSGGPTLWDVAITLRPMTIQPMGSMNVVHNDPAGGSFSASLPDEARFTFTEVGNPSNIKMIDPLETLLFPTGTPWSHTPDSMDAHDLSFGAGDFFAGVDPILNVPVPVMVSSTRLNLNLLPACVPEARAWLMLGAVAIEIGALHTARRLRGGVVLHA